MSCPCGCEKPCGCCEPVTSLTPLLVENRPALSAFGYRIGTYASFRASMLEEIVRTSELAPLTTRLDDDYTVFARVVSGFDVVDRILEGDVMQSVRIVPVR